jgi:hypothetical protein
MEGSRMKPWLSLVVGLGLAACDRVATAQTAAWQPMESTPAASLGTPRPSPQTTPIVRAAAPDPLVGDYSPPARLGAISEVRGGQSSSSGFLDTPEERYNWGMPAEPAAPRPRATASPSYSNFGEKLGQVFEKNGGFDWGNFQGDHCFDDWISPMTNPFLAEDPRALTEIRPIFMYQTIPQGQYLYRGGNIEQFAIQARLALTDRFDIVLHKLGAVVINPGSSSFIGSASGFSEIWLGGKYTFYRDDQTGTLGAAGAIFQIPAGTDRTYQGTGSLSIAPYVTGGQKFGKTSWGTFTVMDTAGVSISVNRERSNYFYNSAHLDFDVANAGRVFPLLELNWFHYTRNGHSNDLGFEALDLGNVGSHVAGRDFLSIAIGARFKVSDAVTLGIATEFPLAGTKDLFNFRLGVDLIWRY